MILRNSRPYSGGYRVSENQCRNSRLTAAGSAPWSSVLVREAIMRTVTTSFLAALAVLIAVQSAPASVLPVASLGSLALGAYSSKTQAAKTASDASPLTRLTTGTKKFFTGVKNAVTPKSKTPKPTARYYTPGSSPRHKTTAQKSSFTSWLHPKESSNK